MHHYPIYRVSIVASLLILPFLAGITVAEEKLSAYQYNQIYGYFSGNKRTIDVPEEMTPIAYTKFWEMDAENRQIAFNSFSWAVIQVLIDLELAEINAPPEPNKRKEQSRIRSQYESLLNLLAAKFSIPIKSEDLYTGLMYFIDFGNVSGNSRFLTITCLIDNINLLKPSGPRDEDIAELKQRVIKISPNGNVFYNDLNFTPDLSKQQIQTRDFLFR